MLLDSGILSIYRLENIAPLGGMPKDALVYKSRHWYGERVVGYSRNYEAMQAGQRVDMLVRIWQDRTISTSDYCLIGDKQYRIVQAQQNYDDDGLRVTDLSLERLGAFYDLASN